MSRGLSIPINKELDAAFSAHQNLAKVTLNTLIPRTVGS
jgi:hypothetical protein